MTRTHRVILFRFHNNFPVCRNHIEIIRRYNPGIPIYGLYGGSERDWERSRKLPLRHIWKIPLDDSYWKWINGDFCIRWWFKEYGKKVPFDMLHVIEWDLILLESVNRYFADVRNGVALTFVKPMSQRYKTWFWVVPERGRWEWVQLKQYVRKHFGYRGDPPTGVFGGAALSRRFLERYAKIEVPGYCNDEVRVPLFADIFGMPVHDTNFSHKYFTANQDRTFSPRAVYRAYKKGVKAFHPVATTLNLATLKNIRARKLS